MKALENELNAVYKTEAGEVVFQRSVQFGKAVAQLVFEWSKTDGAANAMRLLHHLWVPVFGRQRLPLLHQLSDPIGETTGYSLQAV